MHDLTEDEAAGDGVISQVTAGLGERHGPHQDVGHVLAVAQPVEIQGVAGQVRHPGPVRKDLPDGDAVLAISLITRDVVGYGISQPDQPALG
jgi:hypothetical protein